MLGFVSQTSRNQNLRHSRVVLAGGRPAGTTKFFELRIAGLPPAGITDKRLKQAQFHANDIVIPGKLRPENAVAQFSPAATGKTSAQVPVVTISPALNGMNCGCAASI